MTKKDSGELYRSRFRDFYAKVSGELYNAHPQFSERSSTQMVEAPRSTSMSQV
jgi:hypothetical protein